MFELPQEPRPYLNDLTGSIVGAAIEVHRRLGPGFLEAAYEEAFVIELEYRGIQVTRQVPIKIYYREREITEARLDLLVEHEVVVEIKSVERIAPVHVAQVLAYLRASELQLGLLINFNVDLLRGGVRRVINNNRQHRP